MFFNSVKIYYKTVRFYNLTRLSQMPNSPFLTWPAASSRLVISRKYLVATLGVQKVMLLFMLKQM